MLQRKIPQVVPIAESENHLKFVAVMTVLCRVAMGHCSAGWVNSHGA